MSSRIVGIILKPMLSVGEKSGVRRLAIHPFLSSVESFPKRYFD